MQQWTYGNGHAVDWKLYRLRTQNTSLRHDHLSQQQYTNKTKKQRNSVVTRAYSIVHV